MTQTPTQPISHQPFLHSLVRWTEQSIAPRADLLSAADTPVFDPVAASVPALPAGVTGLERTRLIALAGHVLNHHGGVAGVTLSILGRWLTDALVAPFLDLPADATVALAISEPGGGAHPKHMTATAVHDRDHVTLNGQKVFVTNGMAATHILFVAISDVERGRKAFSAYLVHPDDPGVHLVKSDKVSTLHPCSHAALTLSDARLPSNRLIGPRGGAMQTFSGPVRAIEDRIFAYANLGLMQHICERLAPQLPDDGAEPLGQALVRIAAQEQLALRLLEQDTPEPAFLGALSLARVIRTDIAALETLTTPDPTTARSLRDLDTLLSIASNVRRMQVTRLGQELMTQES